MKRVLVEVVVAVVLAVGGGLLLWGSNFSSNMVHDQLADQKISFPAAAGLPEATKDSLAKYAGKQVLDGPAAKAYANQYIGEHLKATNGGKTYSETSTEARKAAADAAAATKANAANVAELQATASDLMDKRQTLFMGETLRGLLLYAWGWWLVGRIAFWVAMFVFLAAAGVLVAAFLTRPHHVKAAATSDASAPGMASV